MAIYLVTGEPTAKVEGAQVAISFPSGKGTVTVAIEPQQAKMLCHELREASFDAIEARRAESMGVILAFPNRA
mgnify:CR=1 FL=1